MAGFTRTYDAQVAQQETRAGAPGPLGFGWTDNWASSLATGWPVPGNLYILDGLATDNGNGSPADDVTAFAAFPLSHWKKIWSTNPQERLNQHYPADHNTMVTIYTTPRDVTRGQSSRLLTIAAAASGMPRTSGLRAHHPSAQITLTFMRSVMSV